MKSLPVLIVLAALLLSTLVISSQTSRELADPFAPPPEPDQPRMIRVHAEFIEMPHTTYTALMARPRSGSNDSDLRQQCTDLIAAGEARIVESLMTNAMPGISATSESIGEYVYPTEYETPGLGDRVEDLTKHFIRPAGSPPSWPAYETKNTGSTFEVEAQIGKSARIVDLRFSPRLVSLSDKIVWSTWRNQETSIDTSTPFFYVLLTQTGISVAAGEPCMVAALSPRDAEGFIDPSRKIMLFVRAEILTVGP